MLSKIEHEKSFITSRQDVDWMSFYLCLDTYKVVIRTCSIFEICIPKSYSVRVFRIKMIL